MNELFDTLLMGPFSNMFYILSVGSTD